MSIISISSYPRRTDLPTKLRSRRSKQPAENGFSHAIVPRALHSLGLRHVGLAVDVNGRARCGALGTNVRPVAGSVATESATLLQPSGPLGVRTSECSTRAGGRRVAAGVDDADERRLQPDAGLRARLLCGEIVLCILKFVIG